MHLISIVLVVLLVVAALSAWRYLDMRSILRSSQRGDQLSVEGRWSESDHHFERALKPRRPFVWFFQRHLLPGSIITQHALFLFTLGRYEEALLKVDQAIRQIESRSRLFSSFYRSETFKTLVGSLRTRTLILTGLGRYEEARDAAARLERVSGSAVRPNAALALLEFYCGRLDEALALARATPPEDTQYDSMCCLAAHVYALKGEFNKAIRALSYEPSDIAKFYSPAGLETLRGIHDGAKLIELQRVKHSGIVQPGRLLVLAHVYLDQGDIDKAVHALDQADKAIGSNPGLQNSYCRHRARSLSALGKADEAESYLGRMRSIVAQLPKRSLLWETHYASGQSYLCLGRLNDALAELDQAGRSALHPIEKHATNYLTAKANEAADRLSDAIPYYQMVASDLIPSLMRKRAAELLAQ